MIDIFKCVLDISLTTSYVAIIIMIIRLTLKKYPKIFSYALWLIVLFRLICPFDIESNFSLVPSKSIILSNEAISNSEYTYEISIEDKNDIENIASLITYPQENHNGNYALKFNSISITSFISYVWFLGVIVILLYGVISYLKLKERLQFSTSIKSNVYENDRIKTAFVLGFLKPNIYVPINLTEDELEHILSHEETHIKRLDHIIKIFAFIILTIHWFNPIMWFSFILMTKDMEMSCDEAVIKKSNIDIRKNYSKSLLSFSCKKDKIISPIAFGESDVKLRIKNILNYKKPRFWVSILILIFIITIGFMLVSNPKTSIIKSPEITATTEDDLYELINYGNKTNKKSVNDAPYVDNYEKINVNGETYYLYKDNRKYYVEKPYQFINSITKGHYYKVLEVSSQIENNTYQEEDIIDLSSSVVNYYDGNDIIEKLVYETENRVISKTNKYENTINIIAPHIFGAYEEGNKIKVFATTFSSSYVLKDKTLYEDSVAVVPVAITYEKLDNEVYAIEKYEQTKDGREFENSIKDFCIMPISGNKIKGLSNKIMRHYSNYDDIIKLAENNLNRCLKANNLIDVAISDKMYDEVREIKVYDTMSVNIESDVTEYALYMSSVRGITLWPQVFDKPHKDTEMVCHWKLEGANGEGFETTDGVKNELYTDLEEVLLVGYGSEFDENAPVSKTIKVILTIENKKTNEVLAKSELEIEDHEGYYKVKK